MSSFGVVLECDRSQRSNQVLGFLYARRAKVEALAA
jgi:hypothetical protein